MHCGLQLESPRDSNFNKYAGIKTMVMICLSRIKLVIKQFNEAKYSNKLLKLV